MASLQESQRLEHVVLNMWVRLEAEDNYFAITVPTEYQVLRVEVTWDLNRIILKCAFLRNNVPPPNATTCSYELSWFPSWLWR